MIGRAPALGLVLVPLSVVAWLLGGCLETRGFDEWKAREQCTECHGGTLDPPKEFPEWLAAPPYNLSGETDVQARGNGAHEAHLRGSGKARALLCKECHVLPETTDAPGHIDSPYPAELIFSGPAAAAFEATPVFDPATQTCKQTFCHGGYFVGGRPSGGRVPEPRWTDNSGAPAACDGCHGLPPPEPHPRADTCSDCHMNIGTDRTFTEPDLHVDGKVTFYLPSR